MAVRCSLEFYRPAIVVPGGTLRKLSPPELAMVLGHELAHIRRGDLLWNLAAAVRASRFLLSSLGLVEPAAVEFGPGGRCR